MRVVTLLALLTLEVQRVQVTLHMAPLYLVVYIALLSLKRER